MVVQKTRLPWTARWKFRLQPVVGDEWIFFYYDGTVPHVHHVEGKQREQGGSAKRASTVPPPWFIGIGGGHRLVSSESTAHFFFGFLLGLNFSETLPLFSLILYQLFSLQAVLF